jgi:thioredoxin reductase
MELAKPGREMSAQSQSARVCVIGAGCSGLVALKALREVGVDCVAFDLGSDVGGLWDQNNTSGRSAAYDSLRINTSRQQMEFSDYPMDPSFGDYPCHHQVASYFRGYADRFGLRDAIRFQTEVETISPLQGDGYLVRTRPRQGDAREERFDAVIVASGHHFSPAFPNPAPEGSFSGETLHSHTYKSPDRPIELRGKRVVVVGMGNSAMDIATELARSGSRVFLSYRRGVWVLPRYLFGKPVDQGTLVPHSLPPRLRRRLITFAFRRLVGSMSDFGLPEPDHLIGEAHPTLSSELPELVRTGRVQMRKRIAKMNGRMIAFEGGAQEEVDAIVYCTGYRVTLPFIPTDHVNVTDNQLPLFLRVFHPMHRRLFFIGFAQPHGAIMPIAEKQASLVASHLAGGYNLPAQPELERAIAQESLRLEKRYVKSTRHTMQIDPEIYGRILWIESLRGALRAKLSRGQTFGLTGKRLP